MDRALKDESQPIPVVFNLSTWAVKREPLASWLASELDLRSGVSKKLSQRWVDSGEVLPLLDGLDEVDAVHRSACLDAINEFRSEWGLLPMAECSRIADFEGLDERLRLNGAVVVQQLARSHIDNYLARSTGGPFSRRNFGGRSFARRIIGNTADVVGGHSSVSRHAGNNCERGRLRSSPYPSV